MSQTKTKNKNKHVAVLVDQVLDVLKPESGERYLDLTAGYGGHAGRILELTGSGGVLVDRDQNAVAVLEKEFSDHSGISIRNTDFLQVSKDLSAEGQQFDLILADIGVSSPHLDNADRGFSLASVSPLDMRMDTTQELSAAVVVNTYAQKDLETILRDYGEEPKARRMAQNIVESRPLKTTTDLARIAQKVWPGRSRVHPATRLFQAIRIEVNSELEQLREVLPIASSLLKPGGRMAVISFHSLEDRIVKHFLADNAGEEYDAEYRILTARPLVASPSEIVHNPRARSAKLRAWQRK